MAEFFSSLLIGIASLNPSYITEALSGTEAIEASAILALGEEIRSDYSYRASFSRQ